MGQKRVHGRRLLRRPALALVALAAGGLGAASAGAVGLALWPGGVAAGSLVGLGAIVGGIALWLLFAKLVRLHDGLDSVRGDIATLIAHGVADNGLGPAPGGDADAARLAALVADLSAALAGRRQARLAAILATLGDAVVVATDSGQVSLVNGAAKALLGAERVAVGTSLYAALDRNQAAAAAARARADSGAVEIRLERVDGTGLDARVADLGGHGGTVYSFTAAAARAPSAIDHDLALHDPMPAPAPVVEDTPLAALPVVVVDIETTGLDVDRDRLVSLGAVQVQGSVIMRAGVLDLLVNPGLAIPARSTRIHGITDAMVADSPPFRDIADRFADFARGRIVVGHQIGFDLAVMGAESNRCGRPWTPLSALDLVQLGAALEPRAEDLSLEGMAARRGVAIAGRHTALGDALVTAELWLRLWPRLAERGIDTFGAARRFAGRARAVIRGQRQSGW
ncbi:MAG: exonuclease domain-containing protein [Alphaproteobacteria bacterium]|jgi:DNA polymerase-3 subunit epsilon|nr:exonuclease domain-containing protein [Alphaproteobacteria bacterium]